MRKADLSKTKIKSKIGFIKPIVLGTFKTPIKVDFGGGLNWGLAH